MSLSFWSQAVTMDSGQQRRVEVSLRDCPLKLFKMKQDTGEALSGTATALNAD
jgi:hypothetical protein